MIKIKTIIGFLCCTLGSFNSNAAIIDSQAYVQDSYVDTLTGLAWLDFGVNNRRSYNDISTQLVIGGDYFGWRLPTSSEVYTLWHNVANLDNVEADYESPDEFGTGQFVARDDNSRTFGGDDSVWDDTFAVMGYNIFASTDFMERTNAFGFFMGENGLATVSFSDAKSNTNFFTFQDEINLRDNGAYSDFFLNFAHENYSTLLVREASVPEPASLMIAASAITFLYWRRIKKRGYRSVQSLAM